MYQAGIVALTVTVGACGPRDEPGVDRDVDVAEAPVTREGNTIDIEDVVDNPTAYTGRTVTLSGEVEETYDPGRAFSMTGSGVIAENQILVLTKGQHAVPVEEGRTLRATGMVRTYSAAERQQLQSELGWEFDDELAAELDERKSVLIAENISAAPAE
jgi:hypothetical protein